MNYREASKKYRKAIYLLENTNIKTDEEEAKVKAVSLKVYLNMSQICLKQAKPKKAIFYCKSALELDPGNIKATFRYGQVRSFTPQTLKRPQPPFLNLSSPICFIQVFENPERF